MANKMLIDAAHPEETRVVVVRGNRIEEFDYESANKKQLRGNIYLAKVTRVEPSLQAAFVEYGGNRHGFLAFNEIHPDYYQIPVADRIILKEEEARDAAEQRELEAKQEEAAEKRKTSGGRKRRGRKITPKIDDLVEYITESAGTEYLAANKVSEEPSKDDAEPANSKDNNVDAATSNADTSDAVDSAAEPNDAKDGLETVGAEDALEEVPARPKRRRRKIYRIQEVIKRNQIILIQVVKEERGNKGAALTTYISLAGRYTVLMPNTARGGGISRKITNIKDRKRLREIANNVKVPEGTGLIVRTAGAARTKAEIKRDFDYLLRLWENIREYTLNSSAPTLIYEEGNLIKRSIRDLYSKEINEVLVAGDEAYREAKAFMRLIMPSHAKNVHHYKDQEPLFMHHQVERQLNAMFDPEVKLKSGGYIVINQTEALVAVDVNSGKATREFSIEETALNTNLEAAKEVARQLRLRDLAGLIVIDFIDMDERKNNRAVEQMTKNSLKSDRARIQVGPISGFGLLEMSRQRLRTGVLEGSTTECSHCLGTGIIRSTESVALYVLRSVEDSLMTGQKTDLKVNTTTDSALYILNFKRAYLKEIEHHYGITVTIVGNSNLHGINYTIEKGAPARAKLDTPDNKVVSIDWAYQGDEENADTDTDIIRDEPEKREESRQKRNRRPRRRKPRGEAGVSTSSTDGNAERSENSARSQIPGDDELEGEKPRRSRRRGRRGGRGRNNTNREKTPQKGETGQSAASASLTQKAETSNQPPGDAENAASKTPASSDRSRKKPAKASSNGSKKPAVAKEAQTEVSAKPVKKREAKKVAAPEAAPNEAADVPKKRGWWQRKTS
ncbi:MAG: ribonuclease E/G [bacterium]|nr:ribonuclease E/G [bacterium]